MTDYFHFLAIVCLTIITLVITVGGTGLVLLMALAIRNLIKDNLK